MKVCPQPPQPIPLKTPTLEYGKVEFFIHRAKAGSGNVEVAALRPGCPGRMCVAPGGGSRGGTGLQLLF